MEGVNFHINKVKGQKMNESDFIKSLTKKTPTAKAYLAEALEQQKNSFNLSQQDQFSDVTSKIEDLLNDPKNYKEDEARQGVSNDPQQDINVPAITTKNTFTVVFSGDSMEDLIRNFETEMPKMNGDKLLKAIREGIKSWLSLEPVISDGSTKFVMEHSLNIDSFDKTEEGYVLIFTITSNGVIDINAEKSF
jgi:hypothetical protein